MDSHKTTVLALSLSVLTLAVVSTFLSLNQSGVLGDSTSAGKALPPRPTTMIAKPMESGVCRELGGLFNNYCLRGKDDVQPLEAGNTADSGDQSEPFPARKDSSGMSGVCGDLFKLTQQFCPKTTPGPQPSGACKYGVNSFATGTPCKTSVVPTGAKEMMPIYRENSFQSAKYTCYDGTTGEVKSPNTACTPESVLRSLARKACEGHGTCKNPEKPTGRPEEPKHCTGDKDCEDTEVCLLPPSRLSQVMGSKDVKPEWLAFGRCVPKAKTTTSPRLTPKVSAVPTKGELSCTWCGTSCVANRMGLKCPLMSAPIGKDCVAVGNACKIVSMGTTTN